MVRDLLKIIESSGHTAYIVGGYTRDKLLGMESHDVDIATSAPSELIKKIFQGGKSNKYGCVSFTYGNYFVEVTTYRVEADYVNRHPNSIKYTSDILKDLNRRDFTINAILMDSAGKIVDPLGGLSDLNSKLIRVIGDIESKLTEDPLRILRAIRLSVTRSLRIEPIADEFIKKNIFLLKTLSHERRKRELNKIFFSENAKQGVSILKEYEALNTLGLRTINDFVFTEDILSAWAQFDFDAKYPFKKKERILIKNISTIIKLGKIDSFSLLTYGLEANLRAGRILSYDEQEVYKIYDEMIIKNESDLAVSGDVIRDMTGATGEKIGIIKKDLLNVIISGNLPNKDIDIKEYLIRNWK